MTDEILAWQTERFLSLVTHREGHVVHVRPEQVVEIAFDGVQRCTAPPGASPSASPGSSATARTSPLPRSTRSTPCAHSSPPDAEPGSADLDAHAVLRGVAGVLVADAVVTRHLVPSLL